MIKSPLSPENLPLADTRTNWARRLATTTQTLERAELRGVLKAHRQGGNIIIYRDDMLRYLKNRKEGGKNGFTAS
jgi:hypothetical protein